KALDLSQQKALLDLAGGSGIYSCALVAKNPHLRASVLERPPVDRIATECIAKQGCSGRVNVLTGDIFAAPLPTGFDVHLWSNVLHDWDDADVRKLLAKSREALPSGGLVVIHDAFINAEKTGPLHI